MKNLFLLFALLWPLFASAQGIHKEETDYYNSLGIDADTWALTNVADPKPASNRAACTLNKMVYGWHPYWSNGLEVNYDWSLLSHFCYFSYEVDAATGSATSTHAFSTTTSVTTALANGVKVNLCVTLFSGHSTFLTNAIAKQNLIDNLINLISTRGAHGVNIDFEGLPLSQKTNFTNFMNDLASQMHTAIPGSEVSSVLYAVDWNDVIDVAAMTNVDYFVIMGYDYYWTGSSTAGPNDPLYHFSSSYNYTLSKSITNYLDLGLSPSKLVLGLPYYGREWAVASSGIPSSTTGTGVSRTFDYVKNNTSGNYSAANRHFDNESYSAYYEFNSGGLKQCFISEQYEMEKRLDLINKRGIAGMGIWALGYDDGYTDFWDAIANKMTDCAVDLCSDTLFDMGGGPNKAYYDNEDYTYTIAPVGASAITVNFSAFNLEPGYDFLYVYDGGNTSAAQFPGSPFTGTTIPAALNSSTGAITFRFTSDGSTISSGFKATYQCFADNTSPTTTASVTGAWQTGDFTVNFTDTDDSGGSGISQRFYQALDYDGVEWRGNNAKGFFNDNFQLTVHPEWTSVTGSFVINTNHLYQTSETDANTNLYANLVQDNSHAYLYHWQMNQDGTGTNRRAGLHFFCDNPALPNRGNSYFVYFRVDSDKCQIYEVNGDVFTLQTDDPAIINPGVFYDCKVFFDPSTGQIKVYLDDVLVSEWTDPSPLANGNSISVRTGNTSAFYDDLKVYQLRIASESISIGTSADMVRYQNYGPGQNSCRIVSLVNDLAGNWSNPASTNVNIDWTNPASITVMDTLGADIDAQTDSSKLSGEWTASTDAHSDIDSYWYSVGNTPGDSSIIGWTNNLLVTNFTMTGLSLNYGQTYYINVRVRNGAGLIAQFSSDGITIVSPTTEPVCAFTLPSSGICSSDSIMLTNSTIGANAYLWSGAGVIFSDVNDQYPYVSFPASGSYTIQLVATGPGGDDTLVQSFSVTLFDPAVASFSVSNDTVNLPFAFVACTNSSLNATSYSWSFGDGNVSSDTDPWNNYTSPGNYQLILVASNGVCPNDTLVDTIVVELPLDLNETSNHSDFEIFPNPMSGFCQFTASKPVTGMELVDMQGRVVVSQKYFVPGIFGTFDFSSIAPATYIISFVFNDKSKANCRIIKN
ncbi:MAG TPA: glycosyl hydrolase family 18 protein [Flavobacteriales bacterium]|nr:glycosyl hydrolase family 18 protein [Flavobacteriales bacterium]